jgi:hypothetical protein
MYYCRFPLLFQGLGHVEFMVGVVALWWVSVKCLCFPLSVLIPPVLKIRDNLDLVK